MGTTMTYPHNVDNFVDNRGCCVDSCGSRPVIPTQLRRHIELYTPSGTTDTLRYQQEYPPSTLSTAPTTATVFNSYRRIKAIGIGDKGYWPQGLGLRTTLKSTASMVDCSEGSTA